MTAIICRSEECIHNDGEQCTAVTIHVAYNGECLTWEEDDEE